MQNNVLKLYLMALNTMSTTGKIIVFWWNFANYSSW